MSQMDDAELLAEAARGNRDAFATFYRRHLALVVAFCARATGDRELGADLTGEVFAAALEACGRYRREYETAAPWLIGIAQNKLRESQRRGRVQDAVRRRLRMRRLELEDEDLDRVEALVSAGQSAVLAAVEALPAAERDAVRARVVEDRGYQELAAEMQCSEAVVRQRVSRGLARARGHISSGSEPKERP